MPRMIDLIRASAVPATLVQSAARGALAIPPPEMLEILVYLATENKVFGEQARLTLAGWNEAACQAAASSPATSKEVLAYFSAQENFPPVLLPVLLSNASVSDESLAALVTSISRDQVEIVLGSDRANHSEKILAALASNHNLTGIQSATVEERLSLLTRAHDPAEPSASVDDAASAEAARLAEEEREADEAVAKFLFEHATEIAAEGEKPFQAVGGIYDEAAAEMDSGPVAISVAAGENDVGAGASTSDVPLAKRGSALQRISKLDVKGRVQMALKGSKEERALLIRDGTKIVALAVLDSPKISDGEVEKFAGQRNVQEAVLRGIPMKRRFMKQYGIVRNLVFNPRTPIDVSLTLMKNLLPGDLKNLSGSKEVPDTVKKSALRMFKQKLTTDK